MLIDDVFLADLVAKKESLWKEVQSADKAAAETAESVLAKELTSKWGECGRLIDAAKKLLDHEKQSAVVSGSES